MRSLNHIILLFLCSFLINSCGEGKTNELPRQKISVISSKVENKAMIDTAAHADTNKVDTTTVQEPKKKNYKIDIFRALPHDVKSYTQGYEYYKGELFESAGLRLKSSLRKVDPETGDIIKKVPVPIQVFAEGITIMNDKLYMLTWRAEKGYIFDPLTLKQISEFDYRGEGWGLTHDKTFLIMSDGSNVIKFLDPVTMEVVRQIYVNDDGRIIDNLNELEYIDGYIFANVYMRDLIIRIDPGNGDILDEIDVSMLRDYLKPGDEVDVINGIAFDPETRTLYLTGKDWPYMFEGKLSIE